MKTLSCLLSLTLLAGCSQGPKPAPSTPAPRSTQTASSTPPAAESPSASRDTAPAEPADTALPLSEEIDELQQASDSAADAEVLEELESTVSDSNSTEPAGADEVVEAATWDIDVATFTHHDRVQYFLDFFQGPARPRMTIWLERMKRILDGG